VIAAHCGWIGCSDDETGPGPRHGISGGVLLNGSEINELGDSVAAISATDVSGVLVYLFGAGSAVIDSVLTESGEFEFPGLPEGDYVVGVYQYPGRMVTSRVFRLQGADLALPTLIEIGSDGLSCLPVPFERSMMIQFEVRSQTSVRVDIYDVRPQRIRRLVDDVISPRDGGYVVTWNGQNELGLPVKNGYYWAVLRTDDVLEKRLLVKRRIN
jgi:hypothetical protein